MEIQGYKCFNFNRTNRYGMPFEEGDTYKIDGPVRFGNDGNGFHFCEHLSDVFRYFDVKTGDYTVASITGRGQMIDYDDEYYGYEDMHACSEIVINKFLSREEIIDIMLKEKKESCLEHFFMTFPLYEEEKYLFYVKVRGNNSLLLRLLYYQFGYKNIYNLDGTRRSKNIKRLEKVIFDGQDNSKRSQGK